MPNKYKHLFFDLDHTLWDFETNAKQAMADLFEQMDLQTSLQTEFEPFYERYAHHNEVMWDRFNKGHITREELRWKRMWRTLLDFKKPDETLAKELGEAFLEILPTKTNVFPYTFEILDYLSARGYELHLITNGFDKVQFTKLRKSGLDKYFKQVITSEASNSMKPKKEIFDFALERTGAQVQESIMIGDNADADILGAINAGWHSIYVNHIGARISQIPTYEITNLEELKAIF